MKIQRANDKEATYPDIPLDRLYWRARIRSSSNYVSYEPWVVVKSTPKGAWVVPYWSWRLEGDDHEYTKIDQVRWTPEDGRFCSKTQAIALDRLKARTRSYVRHSKRALREAERRYQMLFGSPPIHPRLLGGLL